MALTRQIPTSALLLSFTWAMKCLPQGLCSHKAANFSSVSLGSLQNIAMHKETWKIKG